VRQSAAAGLLSVFSVTSCSLSGYGRARPSVAAACPSSLCSVHERFFRLSALPFVAFVSFVLQPAACASRETTRRCRPPKLPPPPRPPQSDLKCSTFTSSDFFTRGSKNPLAREPPLVYISICYANRERPRTCRPLFENLNYALGAYSRISHLAATPGVLTDCRRSPPSASSANLCG